MADFVDYDPTSPTWTLEEALILVRALQPTAWQYGYHLCLGGGVLNKGVSSKDLDLYFLEMDNQTKYPSNLEGLLEFLNSVWTFKRDLWTDYGPDAKRDEYGDPISTEGQSVYTRKIEFIYSGTHRIDVFII